jgi:alpha-D-ribose 1-methylphosphonate 5-triphosphate synthase subunit PhnG
MFQAFDNARADRPVQRADWMALLARSPLNLLESALGEHAARAPEWLRRPETGLMMVQGRAGGTGERFNLGEVTVTRCVLRLGDPSSQATVGVAYVMGRSHRHAMLAATADALLQDPERAPALHARLLNPVREHLARALARRQRRAAGTRVNFLTVAREAGSDDAGNDEGDAG